MRPRILHPFYVEVAMLDAVATREETEQSDDVPELVSGFDDDFKEVIVFSSPAGRTSGRLEQVPLFIPSQIESPSFEALQQMSAGNMPDYKFTLVWARKDLECLNLIVPETGECLVRVNDRVVSIRDKCLHVIQTIRTPPGLYVTEVRPTWGIAGHRDLFLVTLDDREQGVRQ
jgi:hypothetical protein